MSKGQTDIRQPSHPLLCQFKQRHPSGKMTADPVRERPYISKSSPPHLNSSKTSIENVFRTRSPPCIGVQFTELPSPFPIISPGPEETTADPQPRLPQSRPKRTLNLYRLRVGVIRVHGYLSAKYTLPLSCTWPRISPNAHAISPKAWTTGNCPPPRPRPRSGRR